ncbi:M42 family metallopeptidase [Candidatus Hodarchaeum mangrovi]
MIPELLNDLIAIPGQSGHESRIRNYLCSKFRDYSAIKLDRLGSVICHITGKKNSSQKKQIMISAHMDTCGFIVHSVQSNGMVKVVSFGYNDVNACHLQLVGIQTPKKMITGLMYASKSGEESSFEIDTGTQTELKFISPGDPVHFLNNPYLLGDPSENIICSPRLDNRIGVFELLLLANHLASHPPSHDIYLVGTVEEEVGARGAKTAAQTIKPDIAIVLDATYHMYPVEIGKGPVITLSDKAVVLPTQIRDYLLELAESHSIALQTEVWNIGATDATTIRTVEQGVPTIPILTAIKNAHTPGEIVCLSDCYDKVTYIIALIEKIEAVMELFERV